MQQATVIVTGANGIVGSQVVNSLVSRGLAVTALVRQQPLQGPLTNHALVQVHELDLATVSEAEIQSLFARTRPVALIHCAALVNADLCEQQPALASALNTDVTGRLARACARFSTHCLFVSTDYVYAGECPTNHLYGEEEPACPLNVYGYSKWQGELAVQEACVGRTGWSICRTSVVYGASAWTRPDFPLWLVGKLRKRETVRIVNDQISSPTLAEDLAWMLVELACRRQTGIYHTAGSSALGRYSFARLIAQFVDLDERLITPVSSQDLQQVARRPLNTGLSIDKIATLLGKRPLSVAEGLARVSLAV